jgi:hypothetical protein
LWIEWNAAILRILRVTTGNGDLVSLPVDVPILNPQHLAPATARLQGADDSVVHRGTDVLVFGSPLCPDASNNACSSCSPMRRSRFVSFVLIK